MRKQYYSWYRIVFSFICFFIVINVFAQWPQWRGSQRDGICAETDLLKSWPVEGLKMRWSVDVVGDGFSSTAIQDKMVYTIGKRDSVEILTALDLNGNMKWQTAFGRAKKDAFWPQSRCTPTVYGNQVYAISVYGDVACVDSKTGNIVWQMPAFEKFESLGYNMPYLGVSESPLVVNDKLILTPCGNSTTMVALNRMTGETIWKTESLKDSTFYTSPILFPVGYKNAIFTSTNQYNLLVDSNSGKIIWNDSIISGMVPLIVDDKIYCTGQYKKGGALCRWNSDFSKRSIAWRDSIFANPLGGAVLFENKIIVSGDPKGIYCLDPENGKILSHYTQNNSCNFLVADKMLYTFEDKGSKLSLFRMKGNNLELVSSFKINSGKGPCIAHLSIADGLLFVRRGKVLMAYDLKQQ